MAISSGTSFRYPKNLIWSESPLSATKPSNSSRSLPSPTTRQIIFLYPSAMSLSIAWKRYMWPLHLSKTAITPITLHHRRFPALFVRNLSRKRISKINTVVNGMYPFSGAFPMILKRFLLLSETAIILFMNRS